MRKKQQLLILLTLVMISLLLGAWIAPHSGDPSNTLQIENKVHLPIPVESYHDEGLVNTFDMLLHRIKLEPFNLFATIIFFLAITHILSASWFKSRAHALEHKHKLKVKSGLADPESHSLSGGIFHFLGEVEAIFGIWTIALAVGISIFYDWETFVRYIGELDYNEPMYTVVIMTIASSRPILKFVELFLWRIVKLFGGTLEVWWLVILIIAPLSASFITEPAAMTIGAFLLAEKFYALNPNRKLKYATLALLFVNVSLGGLLTNFASHPILMVAHTWHWSSLYTFRTFGIKAILSIGLSTWVYFFMLKAEIESLKDAYTAERYKKYIQRRFISKRQLETRFDMLEMEVNSRLGFTHTLDNLSEDLKKDILSKAYNTLPEDEINTYNVENAIEERFDDIRVGELKRTIPGLLPDDMRPHYRDPHWDNREDRVPFWIMLVHLAFISWTVLHANEPVLFIGGFLFFLGFFQITAYYQNRMNLKPALLVAFFVAGIIIHGTLQGWWIEAALSQLQASGLSLFTLVLSTFNDNASITYLGTLVPDLNDGLKYAIMMGTVSGGGLTVIANSPNPVGVSILKKHFKHGISALQLAKYAALPTLISFLVFQMFK